MGNTNIFIEDRSMLEREICEANRKGWNETGAIHERAVLSELLEAVRSPSFCTFDAVERSVFEGIGLAGKSVVQLACNNARELISIKRAGAGRCVGFDISDAFVQQAHRLITAAQLDIQVVRTDVYDIPLEYSDIFDLAYITTSIRNPPPTPLPIGTSTLSGRLCQRFLRQDLLSRASRSFLMTFQTLTRNSPNNPTSCRCAMRSSPERALTEFETAKSPKY